MPVDVTEYGQSRVERMEPAGELIWVCKAEGICFGGYYTSIMPLPENPGPFLQFCPCLCVKGSQFLAVDVAIVRRLLKGAFSSYFSSSLMSIEVTGDLNAFAGMSTATIHTNLPLDRGTVDGTMLRDVLAYNTTSLEGYTSENPLRFFSFDITTAVGETGELSLLHHPSSVSPDLLSWYVDPFVGDDWYIGSADDNSVLTTESFTVRVIPTPAAAALLAFAGLATLRRQR